MTCWPLGRLLPLRMELVRALAREGNEVLLNVAVFLSHDRIDRGADVLEDEEDALKVKLEPLRNEGKPRRKRRAQSLGSRPGASFRELI